MKAVVVLTFMIAFLFVNRIFTSANSQMDSPNLLEESTEYESPMNELDQSFDYTNHALPTIVLKSKLLTEAEAEAT